MRDAPDLRTLPPLTVLACVQAVGEMFDIKPEELVSYRREFSAERDIAIWLASRHTVENLFMIGRRVGGRSPSTVHSAIGRVVERMLNDPSIAPKIADLDAILLDARRGGAAEFAERELVDPIKVAVDVISGGGRANPTARDVMALALSVVQRAIADGVVAIEINGEELASDEPPPAPPPTIVSQPSPRLAQAIERAISAHRRLSDAKFTRDERPATEALSVALNTLQNTFKADLAKPKERA